jgi:hypothetical protein
MKTPEIVLTIPIELVQSLIIRRTAIVYGESGAFSEAKAMECAKELAAIIETYRNLRSVSPQKRLMEPIPDDAERPNTTIGNPFRRKSKPSSTRSTGPTPSS